MIKSNSTLIIHSNERFQCSKSNCGTFCEGFRTNWPIICVLRLTTCYFCCVTGDLAPTHVSTGETVYVTSPNYPGLYPNSLFRVWVVSAPKGYIIRCRFIDLRFPNDNDGMGIGDGFYYRSGKRIETLKKKLRPVVFTTTTT